jgi:hypothetical protein
MLSPAISFCWATHCHATPALDRRKRSCHGCVCYGQSDTFPPQHELHLVTRGGHQLEQQSSVSALGRSGTASSSNGEVPVARCNSSAVVSTLRRTNRRRHGRLQHGQQPDLGHELHRTRPEPTPFGRLGRALEGGKAWLPRNGERKQHGQGSVLGRRRLLYRYDPTASNNTIVRRWASVFGVSVAQVLAVSTAPRRTMRSLVPVPIRRTKYSLRRATSWDADGALRHTHTGGQTNVATINFRSRTTTRALPRGGDHGVRCRK